MNLRIRQMQTPWSPLTFVVDEHDVVVASWFGKGRAGDAGHLDLRNARAVSRHAITSAVNQWIDGDVDALLTVSVLQPGGDFQQSAWAAMREVSGGTTVSYAELAHMAGRPRAVRAAGTACARNQVAPFVPCHRIVRTDGTLGAYGYGVGLKKNLLEHEGAL